ncbi:MAG TPA: DUF4143 domain-containing protein [Candidatus Cloacimonadota bacterium]|nr:DUF4143 domain-containing protein [Candidatus Cloacimonadota bacterium]HPS40300.1 DUF4143 domain-containing protein [Candidatus Cloacimonadota bacterium]
MIKRSGKIYFWDNAIHNAIFSYYRPVELIDDIGKLRENYIVSELFKQHDYHGLISKPYFWRSKHTAEIDNLELMNAQITAFEIKWNPKKKAKLQAFLKACPGAIVSIINPENYFLKLLQDL